MVHGAQATNFHDYAVPVHVAAHNEKLRAEPPPPFSIHLKKLETETAASAELILHNAKIATNGIPSFVEAIAITAAQEAPGGDEEENAAPLGAAKQVCLMSDTQLTRAPPARRPHAR